MNCTNCGNQLSETAKFCPVCGTVVVRDRVAAPPQEPATPQPEQFAQFAVPEAPQQFAQPAAPEEPQQFVQPAAPEAPQQFVQPAAPEAPQRFVQPAAPEAPQQFVQPAAPGAPQQFVQPAVPGTPQQFVQPAVPGTPQQFVQPEQGQQFMQAAESAVPQQFVKAAKPKKSKKWLIPVIAAAVLAIGFGVFWFVYTSRPSYKVKSAFDKTFKLDGLFEKLNVSDIIKNGSGTVDADLTVELGDDVDSVMGFTFAGDDKPSLKYKAVSDGSNRQMRSDLRLGLPFLDMNVDLSMYLDSGKIVVALPGILSKSLTYDFATDNDGTVKEKLGQNYESVRAALGEASKLASTTEEFVKAVNEAKDVLWSTLNEAGYNEVPATDVEEGETGYMVTLTGERITAYLDRVMSIFTQAIEKTGTKTSINKILESQRSRKDFDDYIDDMSKQFHREFDNDTYEVYFFIKDGTMSNLRFKKESSRNNYIYEFIGKGGDYPLQNSVFLNNGYGYMLQGKTRTDGVEKVVLSRAYKSGKKTVDEGYEVLSYTYNDSTGEFEIKAGDTTGGDPRSNVTSFDFDGIKLKGKFEDASGARTIRFAEIDLYRNGTQTLKLAGTVKFSGESKVEEITGNTIDVDSADDNDLQGIMSEVSSYISGITGFTVDIGSFLNGNGLSGYDYGYNYDYDYPYDYYGYDYDYDDYDYDDYDYDDYDYDDYDYDDYDYGDYNFNYNDIYSAIEGLEGLGDLFSSLS